MVTPLQFPSLPTDNLYKFISLSGLVLLVTAIIVPLRIQDEIDRDSPRIEVILSTKANLAVLRWNQAAPPPDTLKTEEAIEKWRASQKTRQMELEDRLRKLEVSGAEYEEFCSAMQIKRRWVIISYVIGIVGVALMGLGFTLWYIRLQQHQDKIVLNQAQGTAANGETPT